MPVRYRRDGRAIMITVRPQPSTMGGVESMRRRALRGEYLIEQVGRTRRGDVADVARRYANIHPGGEKGQHPGDGIVRGRENGRIVACLCG